MCDNGHPPIAASLVTGDVNTDHGSPHCKVSTFPHLLFTDTVQCSPSTSLVPEMVLEKLRLPGRCSEKQKGQNKRTLELPEAGPTVGSRTAFRTAKGVLPTTGLVQKGFPGVATLKRDGDRWQGGRAMPGRERAPAWASSPGAASRHGT